MTTAKAAVAVGANESKLYLFFFWSGQQKILFFFFLCFFLGFFFGVPQQFSDGLWVPRDGKG